MEALKQLRADIALKHADYDGMDRSDLRYWMLAIDDILSSPDPRPAAQPGMVKGLEWIEAEGNYPGQTVWSPKNDIWPCWIVKNLNSDSYIWCEEIGIELAPASPVMGGFQSLDAAKAAAQADYERRILSQIDFAALAAPVSQEPVAWRCDECGCHTYALIDQRQPDGSHAPGSDRRCVNCKKVHPAPRSLTEGAPSEAVVERIVTEVMRNHVSPEYDLPIGIGGCPRVDWHQLRKELVAALLAAKSKGGQADG